MILKVVKRFLFIGENVVNWVLKDPMNMNVSETSDVNAGDTNPIR